MWVLLPALLKLQHLSNSISSLKWSSLTSMQMKLEAKTPGWYFSQMTFGAAPGPWQEVVWVTSEPDSASAQWSLSSLRVSSVWKTRSVSAFTATRKKNKKKNKKGAVMSLTWNSPWRPLQQQVAWRQPARPRQRQHGEGMTTPADSARSGAVLSTFTQVLYLSTVLRYLYLSVSILCSFILLLLYILEVYYIFTTFL